MSANGDVLKANLSLALRPLLSDWPSAVCRLLETDGTVVRVVVAEVRGSAPREAGACMLVTRHGIEGSIGGGHLEWQGIEAARGLLAADKGAPAIQIQRLVLGQDLAQCCGGVVQLWIERLTRADRPVLLAAARAVGEGAAAMVVTTSPVSASPARRILRAELPSHRVSLTQDDTGAPTLFERIDLARSPLWLYGAGHVGQALVRTLVELPFQITWIDSRPDLFPTELPANVRVMPPSATAAVVKSAPPSARHLVMTHDHALDYDLCHAILARNQFAWLGLIGSDSKAARFRSRLRRDGLTSEAIARLTCPIGINGVSSKLPAAIAIGVAAQLLQMPREMALAPTPDPAPDVCSAENCASCASSQRFTR